jgi:AcrR family transcriptional regulator
MAVHRTARARARDQITGEILDEAHRQLAANGAAALSLRSIARELGMVSSAVYRYVASRDDLITRLIVESYDSLGEATERAVADSVGLPDVDRWVRTALAIRAWAIDCRHEYMLLYGTPVPGYAAPDDTVAPGTRVTRALLSIVRDAAVAGRLHPPSGQPDVEPLLAEELASLTRTVELPITEPVAVAVLAAWTQLFGLIGFELTNQTRGVVESHDALFTATARLAAHTIGLQPANA